MNKWKSIILGISILYFCFSLPGKRLTCEYVCISNSILQSLCYPVTFIGSYPLYEGCVESFKENLFDLLYIILFVLPNL